MMKDQEQRGPGHTEFGSLLRVVGVFLVGAGGLFTAVGLISFFSAFGSFEPPRYFWCAFIGLPLLAVGLGVCQAGYIGTITRYFSKEVAPVQKETFNYLAEGTAPGIETLARAVGQGLTTGTEAMRTPEVTCARCHATNPSMAKFCNQCGASFALKVCPKCGAPSAPNVKYCNQCGGQIP